MSRIVRALAITLGLLLVMASGCSHEVTPTSDYDEASEIPVPIHVSAVPGVLGPVIRWEAPDSDFVVIAGWFVDRQRPEGPMERLNTTPVQRREYQDTDSIAVGTTLYRVVAVSRAGVESLPSEAARFVWDLDPPGAPSGLVAVLQANRVVLSWHRSPEFDLFGYNIYRDAELLSFIGDPSMPIYFDATPPPGHRYGYTVTALDYSGQESAPSDTAFVTIP